MKKIILLFLLGILVYSCDVNEPAQYGTLDGKIVGTWLSIEEDSGRVGPKQSISGIVIDGDGYVNLLAVKTATGELTNYRTYGRIVNADKNEIVHEITLSDGTYYNTFRFFSTYAVNDSVLRFNTSDDPDKYVPFASEYTKTTLGAVVTAPVKSEFSIIANDNYLKDFKMKVDSISSHPLAYAYFDQDSLKFSAKCNRGYFGFEFTVKDFHGADVYDSSSVKIFYTEAQGDVIEIAVVDFDSSNVKLNVEQSTEDFLSGTLEFSIKSSNPSIPAIAFTEGKFYLPVYRN